MPIGTQTVHRNIRNMEASESDEVHNLFKRCFSSPFQRLTFKISPHVLIAMRDSKIIGVLVLKLFKVGKSKKVGLFHWIFTAPEVRGDGFGKRLIDEGHLFFKKHGCSEMIMCTLGDNTSSSKLVSNRDFSILSLLHQIKRWGFWLPKVWIKSLYILGGEKFVWGYPSQRESDKSYLQWLFTISVNILVFSLVIFKAGGNSFFFLTPKLFITISLLILVFFGLRELSMRVGAIAYRIPVRYRVSDANLLSSFLFAIISGLYYPISGNIYPNYGNWSYKEYINKLGMLGFIGSSTVLTTCAALFLWSRYLVIPFDPYWVAPALHISGTLVFIDVLLPFYPFNSFNGKRIFNWNKKLWIILAIPTIILIISILNI